jgi:hypothetical protein
MEPRPRAYTRGLGPSMLPSKGLYFAPAIIHCPVDHLRMSFRPAMNGYRCNWSGCPVAYSLESGYYCVQEQGDAAAREVFYGREAICLCEKDDLHSLYIEDFVANRKVRFWVCPVRGCGYEVSQRLEKTADGWRTCGSFEHTKAVRMRR